jgi:hypothetical protein
VTHTPSAICTGVCLGWINKSHLSAYFIRAGYGRTDNLRAPVGTPNEAVPQGGQVSARCNRSASLRSARVRPIPDFSYSPSLGVPDLLRFLQGVNEALDQASPRVLCTP